VALSELPTAPGLGLGGVSQPGGPYDEIVAVAVESLLVARATLFYTLQNAAEFWNACTRPRERNGLGLDVAEADRRLHGVLRALSFAPLPTGFSPTRLISR